MLLLLQPNTNKARLQYVVDGAIADIQYLVYSKPGLGFLGRRVVCGHCDGSFLRISSYRARRWGGISSTELYVWTLPSESRIVICSRVTLEMPRSRASVIIGRPVLLAIRPELDPARIARQDNPPVQPASSLTP